MNTAIVKLDQAKAIPRVGMLATVRNRRGVISAVEPFSDSRTSSLLHLVTIEFSDADGDAEESLLWERERSPVALEPNALPRIDRALSMLHDEFLALKRATHWGAHQQLQATSSGAGALMRHPTTVFKKSSTDSGSPTRWPCVELRTSSFRLRIDRRSVL